MDDRCRECGRPLEWPESMGHDEYTTQAFTRVCVECREMIAEQVREAKREWYEK